MTEQQTPISPFYVGRMFIGLHDDGDLNLRARYERDIGEYITASAIADEVLDDVVTRSKWGDVEDAPIEEPKYAKKMIDGALTEMKRVLGRCMFYGEIVPFITHAGEGHGPAYNVEEYESALKEFMEETPPEYFRVTEEDSFKALALQEEEAQSYRWFAELLKQHVKEGQTLEEAFSPEGEETEEQS